MQTHRRSPARQKLRRYRASVTSPRDRRAEARRPGASKPDDPRQAAAFVGLQYVSDRQPGIRRKKSGKGFVYLRPGGSRMHDQALLRRIRALVIPPAWTDVWICHHADGHLQATGRDARGRKQYRYHPLFREVRDSAKFDRIVTFADALPKIRASVSRHMGRPGLPREKVLATVVHLLETTLIRVGNDDYAKQNKSYGLTTLKNRHVAVEGSELRFRFIGKGGKPWFLTVRNRRVARIVKECQDLPGQELLQYLDDDERPQDVTSSDVNAYLRELTGQEITAKDFRTWAGTVLAVSALSAIGNFESEAQAKRNIRAAVATVAARLGNTPTICRKCYIHPDVFELYLAGSLSPAPHANGSSAAADAPGELRANERAVLRLLVRDVGRQNRKTRRRPATHPQSANKEPVDARVA